MGRPLRMLTCSECGEVYGDDAQFCRVDETSCAHGRRRRAPIGQDEQLGSRYVRGEQIGVGSFGVVFEAHDNRVKKRVAIKLLNPSVASDPRRSLASSARPTAPDDRTQEPRRHHRLRPRRRRRHAFHRHGDLDVASISLRSSRPRGSSCRSARALAIAGQVAQALAAAHDKGDRSSRPQAREHLPDPGGRGR